MRLALPALALLLASPVAAQDVAELVSVTYRCERGVELPVVYVNDEAGHVVALIEGRLLVLPRAISASGARYRADAPDAGYEFWSKGDTAFLSWGTEAESQLLLEECVAEDAGDEGAAQ